MVLIAVIMLTSIADLLLTLTYARGVGMIELNPMARAVMAYDSPGLLAAWKLGLVSAACTIIFAGRRSRFTEAGAWLAALVMAMLTVHWLRYVHTAHELTPYLEEVSEHAGDKWVAMTPTP